MSKDAACADKYCISLTITNADVTPLRLCLEPWGDEHCIAPSKSVKLELTAPLLQSVPIAYAQSCITVEGWEGSLIEVWEDGKLLG